MLACRSCGAQYPLAHGIPSVLSVVGKEQDWNPWTLDKVQMMGNSYYKRAKGELPEKEASKSCARFLKRTGIYSPGDTVLDIGCATGHFLRSFRARLDADIAYTGIDSNLQFLLWGGEVYGIDDKCSFVHCDALNMPFADDAFDVVFVNLFHFFPRIDEALGEAMRVASKKLLWRTPVGPGNYVVKAMMGTSFDELGVISPDRNDLKYTLYMIYTEEYLRGLVQHLGGRVEMIEKDNDFEAFDNTGMDEFRYVQATRTVHGMQIAGSIVLDWHYVVIGV